MHLLSTRNRDEFLATPQLIRFVLAEGMEGPEATLLIKAPTLSQKYLVRLKKLRVCLFGLEESRVGYGVQIDDDPDFPGIIWSVFEYPDEMRGALELTKSPKCVVFLFNELAVNVAWGEINLDFSGPALTKLLSAVRLGRIDDYAPLRDKIHEALDSLRNGSMSQEVGMMSDWLSVPEWHPIESHYVTKRLETSLVSIFEKDEGRQQEEIVQWLVDNLHPNGALRSPQIQEESKQRELSDILLTYEYGCFLVESKTLAIWVRDQLPSRKKMASAIAKHLHKAVGQLAGAIKNLRRGLPITDAQGRAIDVQRTATPHVIVLVPDLNLLNGMNAFGGEFFKRACVECKAFFHILDPAELLRIVQAAEMTAEQNAKITRMMAFDHYLMKRMELALQNETAEFHVLFHRSPESPDP